MKTTISIIALLASLASCSHSTGNAHEDAPSDTIEAVPDTLPQGKALNDIRFEGWSRSQWLDNDYIRTVRRYLDDYTARKETNPDLDPYREQVKSKFVIYAMDYIQHHKAGKRTEAWEERRAVGPLIIRTALFLNCLQEVNAIKTVNKCGVYDGLGIQVSSLKLYQRLLQWPVEYDRTRDYTSADFEGLTL